MRKKILQVLQENMKIFVLDYVIQWIVCILKKNLKNLHEII